MPWTAVEQMLMITIKQNGLYFASGATELAIIVYILIVCLSS